MPEALPTELRQRAVKAYKEKEGTQAQIAQRFMVSVSSLKRWLAQDAKTGAVDPLPRSGNRTQQKLFDHHIEAIESWLEHEPDLFLHELADKLYQQFGVTIDPSQICRILNQRRLVRKKK